ncbi:MAG: restriction endonuclease subunit S [Candidatus Saccharimonadales bacterium]
MCAVLGGKRLPKGEKLVNIPTSFPYIRVTDFDGRGGVDMSDLRYITEKIHEQISRYIINKTDIFLSIAGTIGVTGIVPDELDGANLTENACRLVPGSDIDTRYLYYFTTSELFRGQALAEVKQSAQPKLALTRIKDIKIDLPNLDIQKEIVIKLDSALSKSRELESQYTKKLTKLTDLRQSLLQEAFSTAK